MGEIVCKYCNTMYSHLDFHDGTIRVCCNEPLGYLCAICNERVCPSCHLYDHIEEIKP